MHTQRRPRRDLIAIVIAVMLAVPMLVLAEQSPASAAQVAPSGIVTGAEQSCGFTANGNGYCWGGNNLGESATAPKHHRPRLF